jgi:hypothetical protein
MVLSSSLERTAQLLIQWVPLNITYKKDIKFDLWNTISFRLIQMAQHKAATPIKTKFLCFFEKLRSQGPKRCSTQPGLLIPKVRLAIPHKSLANGQAKKRCWIDSDTLQKKHLVHPFHFLFTRLSLVNTTPFLRYQRKILIFNGILAFQAPHSTGVPDLRIKLSYKSLTENFLLAVQRKVSLRLLRFTSRTLPIRLNQLS